MSVKLHERAERVNDPVTPPNANISDFETLVNMRNKELGFE